VAANTSPARLPAGFCRVLARHGSCDLPRRPAGGPPRAGPPGRGRGPRDAGAL